MKVFIENIKRRPFYKEFDFPQVPREGEHILFEEYDAEDETSVITDVEATVETVIYQVDENNDVIIRLLLNFD